MATNIEFELLLLNENPSESHAIRRNSPETRHVPDAFEPGLRKHLLDAFKDMAELHIWRIVGTGLLVVSKKDAQSLADVIAIDDEDMEIETERGYKTFLSYPRKDIERIDYVTMLLVWKWSGVDAHFNYGPFPGRFRSCICCGKMQWGKNNSGFFPAWGSREPRYVFPDHCFNPQCFSHVIEKMIDPTYAYTPPKPGEDAENALMESIRKDPSMMRYMKDGE